MVKLDEVYLNKAIVLVILGIGVIALSVYRKFRGKR
jgi:hypothetical protein